MLVFAALNKNKKPKPCSEEAFQHNVSDIPSLLTTNNEGFLNFGEGERGRIVLTLSFFFPFKKQNLSK